MASFYLHIKCNLFALEGTACTHDCTWFRNIGEKVVLSNLKEERCMNN